MNPGGNYYKLSRLSEILISNIFRDEDDAKLGDFIEVYNDFIDNKGLLRARLWFWHYVFISFPKLFKDTIFWRFSMFNNYLKIAWRNIKKHKGNSLINISCLAIGMTGCLLIFLWVQNEIGFDRFHENADCLYISETRTMLSGREYNGAGTPPAFGTALKSEYPEIKNTARIKSGTFYYSIQYGEKIYRERISAGDFSLFQMFTFPFIKGSLKIAESDPNSIILTERIAKKYFEDEDPLGRIFTIDNRFSFTVAGVIKNIPSNSSIQFNCIVPLEFIDRLGSNSEVTKAWTNLSFTTYVQLNKGISPETVNNKIKNRIIEGNGNYEQVNVSLSRFSDIHLFGIGGHGGMFRLLFIFGFLALIILLIACFNFMNLFTAAYTYRAKEIGLRKVFGSSRIYIIKQFFSESVLLALFSLILALILTKLYLPVFNDLIHRQLTLNPAENYILIAGSLILAVMTGIIAGSYPSFFLSSFKPVRLLRDTYFKTTKGNGVRKVLVIIQFVASIVLIISTVVVYHQLNFVNKLDLGFNKNNVMYVNLNHSLRQKYYPLKQEISQIPGVLSVTATQAHLSGVYWNGHGWNWKGRDSNIDPLITYLYVDESFAESFKIDMTQGEFFSSDNQGINSKSNGFVIINETLKNIMKTDNPVGMSISGHAVNYSIAGVIKDFHFKPLNNYIDPLIIRIMPENFNYMYFKMNPDNMKEARESIYAVLKKFSPGFPSEFNFLDEDFDRMYLYVEHLGKIFQYFAILAILISFLGLLGLASYITKQRTQEIGIRKAMGASTMRIILLFLKEFLKWVAIANTIAWPTAYLIMSGWLQNFAERVSLNFQICLISGLISTLIAFIAVIYQVFKTARANPVNSLRYE